MAQPLRLSFVMSADRAEAMPDSTGEVAVVGRSNVGKSSLINALANRNGLAMTSKTPGRTRLLNVFQHEGGGTMVDLPGYGAAAVSAKLRGSWQRMIEGYLLERDQLKMVLVLVDGEIGPTPLDTGMLDWLAAHQLRHTVVATKQDKVKPSRRDRRKQELAAGCGLAPGDILWVSAAKNLGLDPLRARMRHWFAGRVLDP